MTGDTDAAERPATDAPETAGSSAEGRDSGERLLSDLFVNAVPIAIIAAFVLLFGLLSPVSGRTDPLLGFHAALVGGIVLVSAVAGWVISREDEPLQGSAGGHDGESNSD